MPKVIEEIRSKYILQILFKYVPFKRMIKIIQYNKALISKLNYTKKEIKNFLFFKKIIKPVANCEDYLPIIKRILIPNDINSNNYIEKLFCTYLNNIKLFIPQINQINGNEIILNNLNSIKISYNHQFIENFYDTSKTLDFKKLFNFCEEYGEKIKEITFMDNNIPDKFEIKEVNYIMKYIITHSNIQKVEDRNTNNKFSFYDKSKFLELLEFKEDIINTKDYKITKKDKNVIDVIKELKSYSLNFDERNSKVIKPFCQLILFNGNNLEELEITKIDSNYSYYFLNSLKNLKKLRALTILSICDNKLFDEISKLTRENSFYKLEMHLKNFEEGLNIINKNLNSLRELTIKISTKINENITIIKIISNIKNLKKLKIIADFPIFDENNIKYLSLNKVEYLEIPLYIKKNKFDFNIFFEKIPNLKYLNFYGINFNNNIKEENIKIISNLNINNNLKNLKKIKFFNSKKNSSFFIIELIKFLSKTNIKYNIKELKFENCDFDKETNFYNLIKLISSYKNIKYLIMNNISFEESEELNYDEINNFEKLEKLYLKCLNYEKSQIKIIYFLYKFAEKSKFLNEIGISSKGLNPYDINLIFIIIKNFKVLTKLNLFDNYSKKDYYTNEEECFNDLGINIGEIINYCMIDLRNINIKKEDNNYPKIFIEEFFHKKKVKNFCNRKENYFCYQNLVYDFQNSKNQLFLKDEKSSKFLLYKMIDKFQT